MNKYSYCLVFQGKYGYGYGWDDLMALETDSQGVALDPAERKSFKENIRLYRTEDTYARGFRTVFRREANTS